MANRILQLLRSSQLYNDLAAAKTAVQGTSATAKDGEIRIARYKFPQPTQQDQNAFVIKSLLCVYHDATGITPAGWTFIQDADASSQDINGLQTEIDAIESGVGLGNDGSYTSPTGGTYVGQAGTNTVKSDIAALDAALTGMDADVNFTTHDDSKIINKVKQVDGAVSANAEELSSIKVASVTATGGATAIAAEQTLAENLGRLQAQINANEVAAGDAIALSNPSTGDNAGKTEIDVKFDNKTIGLNASNELESKLTLNYHAAVTTSGSETNACITLEDTNGTVISTIDVSNIVGNGILNDSSYDPSTGVLTLTFNTADGDNDHEVTINLADMLDINDIVVASNAADYLTFAPVTNGDESGTAGQAQVGVKLADVTYTATDTSNNTPANLTVSTTNGKMLDASDAIPAIKNYVDDVLRNANTNLSITASGDHTYINAEVPVNDNKHVDVSATYGVFNTPTAQSNTLAASTNGLAKAEDVATAVNTVVGNLDGSATASTVAAGTDTTPTGDFCVLTKVGEENGVVQEVAASGTYASKSVLLKKVAATGAAADVSIADAGSLITATTVEGALQEIVGNINTLDGAAVKSVTGSDAININTTSPNTAQAPKVELILDGTTQGTGSELTGNYNALTVTNDGLFLSNVWDCGTY